MVIVCILVVLQKQTIDGSMEMTMGDFVNTNAPWCLCWDGT